MNKLQANSYNILFYFDNSKTCFVYNNQTAFLNIVLPLGEFME